MNTDHTFISYPLLLKNSFMNAGARPVFMATWAERGAPMNESNQNLVTDAYTTIADLYHTYCAPCGDALLKIQQEIPKIAKFGPKFRVKDFVYSIVLRRFRPSAFRSKSSHRLAPSTCVDNAFWAVRRGRLFCGVSTKST